MLKSVAAEASFIQATASGRTTLVDFEGIQAGQPADGSSFSITKSGTVQAKTVNTDHPTVVPQGFQFGVTDLPNTDTLFNNAHLGFSVSGSQHFLFVPVLNGGTSAFYIHSTSAFSSFGFYVTGLGDQANSGTLHIEFDDSAHEDIVVSGSPQGGMLYFSYIGTSVPINDLSFVMTGVTGLNRDVFSIDDIRLSTAGVGATAVPEPSVLALAATGLAGWLVVHSLRKNRARRARA
jgi:hypothetical protein